VGTITTRPKKIEQTSTKWNLVIPSVSRGIPMRNLKGNDFSTCASSDCDFQLVRSLRRP
jgi:hypothetical protein